jgi:ubiquinone/menaquinone biosynthesis C-methylase UbiE
MTNQNKYVHGYSEAENQRLMDQAQTLQELLHHDTVYLAGCRVLEAGCGVGAQTITLATNSPKADFVSIDISEQSLKEASKRIRDAGIKNVSFQQQDIFKLPFAHESFDHIFVCFVLEHLTEPVKAFLNLRRVLKTGGTITVIEGDHGSAYFHPDSEYAQKAINCLIELQKRSGGNSNIGRQLFPLLTEAGFVNPVISPRMVYVDSSRPKFVEGFTKNTFTAMVEGIREQAIAAELMTPEDFNKGIRDLYRTTLADGTFCYTFFKAVGIKTT